MMMALSTKTLVVVFASHDFSLIKLVLKVVINDFNSIYYQALSLVIYYSVLYYTFKLKDHS